MADTTQIGCACGETRLEVVGKPIESVECCCTSCREAGDRMQTLNRTLMDHGTTPSAKYRKDRVRFVAGSDGLKSFRLPPDHSSDRVIATCCKTPVYLEFKGRHWLNLYDRLWPEGTMPAPTMRTMASDLPDGATQPSDIPNVRKQSVAFFAKRF